MQIIHLLLVFVSHQCLYSSANYLEHFLIVSLHTTDSCSPIKAGQWRERDSPYSYVCPPALIKMSYNFMASAGNQYCNCKNDSWGVDRTLDYFHWLVTKVLGLLQAATAESYSEPHIEGWRTRLTPLFLKWLMSVPVDLLFTTKYVFQVMYLNCLWVPFIGLESGRRTKEQYTCICKAIPTCKSVF